MPGLAGGGEEPQLSFGPGGHPPGPGGHGGDHVAFAVQDPEGPGGPGQRLGAALVDGHPDGRGDVPGGRRGGADPAVVGGQDGVGPQAPVRLAQGAVLAHADAVAVAPPGQGHRPGTTIGGQVEHDRRHRAGPTGWRGHGGVELGPEIGEGHDELSGHSVGTGTTHYHRPAVAPDAGHRPGGGHGPADVIEGDGQRPAVEGAAGVVGVVHRFQVGPAPGHRAAAVGRGVLGHDGLALMEQDLPGGSLHRRHPVGAVGGPLLGQAGVDLATLGGADLGAEVTGGTRRSILQHPQGVGARRDGLGPEGLDGPAGGHFGDALDVILETDLVDHPDPGRRRRERGGRRSRGRGRGRDRAPAQLQGAAVLTGSVDPHEGALGQRLDPDGVDNDGWRRGRQSWLLTRAQRRSGGDSCEQDGRENRHRAQPTLASAGDWGRGPRSTRPSPGRRLFLQELLWAKEPPGEEP